MPELTINDNEIHVWSADLNINESLRSLFKDFFLSEEEVVRADSFKFKQHKLYFIASHGYLRLILSEYLGCSARFIKYGIGKYGKPFLKTNRSHIHFNMSHSQGRAMYAVARNTEVGIDIENIDTALEIEQLIEHVLSPQENKIFRKIEEENKHRVFYNIWTCKEAVLKSTGEGLVYPLNELEVLTHEKELFKSPNIISYEGSFFWCYSLDRIPGYAAAIVSKRENNTIRHLDISSISLP